MRTKQSGLCHCCEKDLPGNYYGVCVKCINNICKGTQCIVDYYNESKAIRQADQTQIKTLLSFLPVYKVNG
jgi:hypothetical protein